MRGKDAAHPVTPAVIKHMEDRININDLHEIADSVADELDEHLSLVGDFVHNIPKSDFPFTFLALLSFIPKVESIRIGIFELVELGEFYSEKILFRSITEHFLKFQYIWMRFIHEKSDDPGKDYFIFCGAKEELDFAKSLKARAKVLGQQINIDPLEILKTFEHRLKEESNNSIRIRAEQFTHKNIVSYVSSKLTENTEKSKSDFLLNSMPAYSELSSFVHGGPSTQRFSEACSNPETATEELRSNAGVSLQMSLSVRALTFLLFAQKDERLYTPFRIVNNSLKTKFGNLKVDNIADAGDGEIARHS